MRSEAIEPGDLVIVVRPPKACRCGVDESDLGRVFRVAGIGYGRIVCAYCNGFLDRCHAAEPVGYDRKTNPSVYELWRVRKIPPIDELDAPLYTYDLTYHIS